MNQEILKKLKTAPELSPDVHDGSYELVRTIVSAYRDVDEAVLDYWEYFSHSLQHTKALVSNHQLDPIQATAAKPLEDRYRKPAAMCSSTPRPERRISSTSSTTSTSGF